MHYKTIIWDWNGTLADDVYPSLLSVNDILEKRGLSPINMTQYYEYIDTPISRFYAHIFDLNKVPLEELTREFNEGYAKYFDRLHEGVPQLLKKLREQGIPQVILTSGNQTIIENDTARFGIRDYMDQILGASDLLATGKIQRGMDWIKRQSIPPEDMVMIGDTLHDLDTAKAMGVDCILCAIGHQSEADLRASGVPVVTSFLDLEPLLLGKVPSVSPC
ncbi:MAG: HAD family hydrolase [Oscillospiraceae bacterium]|nr:HAD family hydrolase [Oscillospiraceae bacterium]